MNPILAATVIILFVTLSHLGFAAKSSHDALIAQAGRMYCAARFDSAISLGRQALLSARRAKIESDSAIASILLKIGEYQFAKEAFAASASAFSEASVLLEGRWGCCHPEVLSAKVALAEAMRFEGKSQSADSLLHGIVAVIEVELGDPRVQADALAVLGISDRIRNQFDSAQLHFARALAIYDSLNIGFSERRRAVEISQGRILVWQSMYADAEAHFEDLITRLPRTNALDSLALAESYYHLGQAQRMLGKYTEARTSEEAAVSIRKRVLGTYHYLTAEAIYAVAMVNQDEGDYDESLSLLRQTLNIYHATVGDSDYRVGWVLRKLARLEEDMGRVGEAESLHAAALANQERCLSRDHPGIAPILVDFAGFYLQQKRYLEAEPLLRRALAIEEKVYQSNHGGIAACLDGLGQICRAQGRYEEALNLFQRALDICEEVFGERHPNVAICLQNIASVYVRQQRTKEAERLHEKALAIDRNALSDDHPLLADCLESASIYRFQSREYRAGLENAGEAFQTRKKSLTSNYQVLPEADVLRFAQWMRRAADNYLTGFFASTLGDSAVIQSTSDIVVSTKGEVSDEIFERHKSLIASADATTEKLLAAYLKARRELSETYVRQSQLMETENIGSSLISLSATADSLEGELVQRSASFRRRAERHRVTASRIASLLPRNAALVEYMRYNNIDFHTDYHLPHYLALVIESEGVTMLRDLGDAGAVDSLVSLYLKHFRAVGAMWPQLDSNTMQEANGILGSLYRRIIVPLEDHLQGHDLVLVSPDGALNLLSFGSLKDAHGEFLAERYRFHYLSTARDLLRLEEKGRRGEGLLAVGDPDFNAAPSQRLRLLHTSPPDTATGGKGWVRRTVGATADTLSRTSVPPLPYTRREVVRLAAVWKTVGVRAPQVLVGAAASEERFKREAPGKQVIHLATHGFIPPVRSGDQSAGREATMSDRLRNPLLFSGLLLAGANLQGEGASDAGCEDGFLTADEVAAMNLDGTQWVVLSACETGLGEVETGEGVYGLRRAFQFAGTRTVISALWRVPDKETSGIMERLYSRHTSDLADAMQQMALRQIAECRDKNLPDHPFLWGGFIAVGDWRHGD